MSYSSFHETGNASNACLYSSLLRIISGGRKLENLTASPLQRYLNHPIEAQAVQDVLQQEIDLLATSGYTSQRSLLVALVTRPEQQNYGTVASHSLTSSWALPKPTQ